MHIFVELGTLGLSPSPSPPFLALTPSPSQTLIQWPQMHIKIGLCILLCVYPSSWELWDCLLCCCHGFGRCPFAFSDFDPVTANKPGNWLLHPTMRIVPNFGHEVIIACQAILGYDAFGSHSMWAFYGLLTIGMLADIYFIFSVTIYQRASYWRNEGLQAMRGNGSPGSSTNSWPHLLRLLLLTPQSAAMYAWSIT